ncbi:hypothetical protein PWT90_10804 [Aphanocladium album]|nr:hypothetical protein PWT90_10804 [Aphanocladium album]
MKVEDTNENRLPSVSDVPVQEFEGGQAPRGTRVKDKNKDQLPAGVKVETNENSGTHLDGGGQQPAITTTTPAPLDLASMDKHWNFTDFLEAQTPEYLSAVHICAAGDICDGRPPKPPREEEYFKYDPLFASDDEDFPMREPGPEGPPPAMANHWTVLLELRPVRGSGGGSSSSNADAKGRGAGVKLDMSPGYQATRPFREGTVLVSSRPLLLREEEDNTVKSLRFGVRAPTTVQQVLENMAHNARHRYLFSENGEGSRYWVHTVVADLVTADILGEGEEERAEDAMRTIWSAQGEEKERRGIRRGMFTEWTIRGEKKKSWW